MTNDIVAPTHAINALIDDDDWVSRAVSRIVRLTRRVGSLDHLSGDSEHPNPSYTLQVYNSNSELAVTVDGQLVYGELDTVRTGTIVETVVAKYSTIRHALSQEDSPIPIYCNN